MPLYDYHCENCRTDFTELRKSAEMDQPIACPECGSSQTHRELSGFAVAGGSSGGCSGGGNSPFR